MGVLADKLRTQLADLKRRSDATDRLIAEAQADCRAALAEMDRLARDLEDG